MPDSEDRSNAYRHPLDAFFKPRVVAVVGASDKAGSVGRAVLWNLISSPFGGTVYAVNPRRRNVLGIRTYPDIASIPEAVDLAIIATPAATVPGVIDECIAAGVAAALIISAGFGETGAAGHALEAQIRERIVGGQIRIIGPNSLGVMNPVIGLNAAFSSGIAKKGTVGFISQSGAVCASILDWSLKANVGFSAFVSFGSMIDVNWADLLYYLGADPATKSILLYMQTLGDARSFLSAAREVALNKPIILLKPGRTPEAAEATKAVAYYHEGDVCDDAVLSAALRRCGVLRVDDIDTLFSLADVLGKQPRPNGPCLAVLSNAGGPGILAADALIGEGGQLAALSEETRAALDALLPDHWSHGNPVDILADADPERYAQAIYAVACDDQVDGLLVVLAPQVMTRPTETAARIVGIRQFARKPILASWMGGDQVSEGAELLAAHNIPSFPYPDNAARIFAAMWRYSYMLRGLYETPMPASDPDHEEAMDHSLAERVIAAAYAAGRHTLNEFDSKQVLAAYGIPVVGTRVAHSEDEAVGAAEALGYPVALAPNSGALVRRRGEDIHLALADETSVRSAYRDLQTSLHAETPDDHSVAVRAWVQSVGYRIVLGSHIDPHFGPVLSFGAGGPLGEIFRDRVLGLPPLNTTLARRMMEQTRIYDALRGLHGFDKIDLAQLELLLVRFSHLVVEQRRIRSIDVNPFLATPDRLIALDARVTLHDAALPDSELPPLAIRPYPREYTSAWKSRSGESIVVRPIRPEDEQMMARFHESLSRDTVYYRYLRQLALDERIKHEHLAEICFIDYDRAMTLVAVGRDPFQDEQRILGVCRMVKLPGGDADFAIVISDAFQRQGLGPEMMRRLIDVAKAEHMRRLVGTIFPENRPMLRMCAKLGFRLEKPVGEEVIAEMIL